MIASFHKEFDDGDDLVFDAGAAVDIVAAAAAVVVLGLTGWWP